MNKFDDKIQEKIDLVKQRLEDIKKRATKSKWETHGIPVIDENSGKKFVLKTANQDDVISFYALLKQKAFFFEEAIKDLDIKAKPFMFSGHSLEEWKNDVNQRLAILVERNEKDSLETSLKRLEAIMSDDHKRQSEFNDIVNSII